MTLKEIFLLESDWDDNGAKPIDYRSILRVEDFLEKIKVKIEPSPVPNGSIDLHWILEDREILINSGVGSSCKFSFYGEMSNEKIKGMFRPEDDFEWLNIWLDKNNP